MRDQLIQYVNLLFAGAPDSDDIRQEILQNTLDRYDDLIGQSKTPEAAYRLAISGIGDVNEILGSCAAPTGPQTCTKASPVPQQDQDNPAKKLMRAIAIGLYIICMIPLFILSEMGMDTLGLCATLSIVAVATVVIILGKKQKSSEECNEKTEPAANPKQELRKSINSVIWSIGLVIYFVVSFLTGAWHITWIIFLIIKCVQGLAWAIMDLKEACEYEE